MFTRNKRNYRTFIFSAVIVTLLLLILALAWPISENEPSAVSERGNSDRNPSRESSTAASSQESVGETDSAENKQNEERNINSPDQSYYLVKKAGGQISVFFYDGQGRTVQLENTEILYDMLGPEDQKLFDVGIQVKSQEELSALLQDFES